MIKIYILGRGCIYDAALPYTSQSIQKPKLDLKANSAGSLTFTISKDSFGYADLNIFKAILYVTLKDEIIWAGRVYEEQRDENNDRKIECEGALAFLNDSIQPNAFDGMMSKKWQFINAIEFHNSQMTKDSLKFDVSAFKGSYEGYFDKILDYELPPEPDPDTLPRRENDTTLDYIMDNLAKKYGGYFKVTHTLSQSGSALINTLDYIDAYEDSSVRLSNQEIRFGENLISLERTATADDFATIIYPIGDTLEDYDKAWTMYKHIANGYFRYFNESPINYSDIAYVSGYRIDSEDGLFKAVNDSRFSLVRFIPVVPGERYFLTTYVQGVPLSQSPDGKTALGVASYCIHRSDYATPVVIGSSAKNSKRNDVEETGKVELELHEIKIPEDGALLSIGIYNPDGLSKPFELRKFNPYYAETNYSIISAPVHTPTSGDPIEKSESYEYRRDTYPSETWRPEISSTTKYEEYFESRIVKDTELVAEFGAICKTIKIEGASYYNVNKNYLYGCAVNALKKMTEKIELRIKAVDLSFLDDNAWNLKLRPFKLLDLVRAKSPPHNLDVKLPILEISMPLDAPEDAEYTLANEVETRDGEPSYMTVYMSDMYKKGKG